MKINKIYISAFGGLKDFTLEFNDGFNVIYGQNEDGKTTVMAFIKAMFYGTGGKLKSLENSPRVRYTPWDGSAMAGRIYFESGHKNYCLEREFRKSDSTDRVIITDLDSGESQTAESNIGLRFFGVNTEAFEKSMFISSYVSGIADSDAVGELNSKLSNLALTGDETVSYQAIADRISSAKEKLISKSGKTGSYIKGLERLKELKEKYEDSKFSAKRQLEISAAITLHKGRLLKAQKRLSAVKKLLEGKDDALKLQKLKEYLELKARLEVLKERFTTEDGREIDVKSLEFCLNKAELAENKALSLEAEAKKIEDEINISSKINAADAAEQIKDLECRISALENSNSQLLEKIDLKKQEAEQLKQRAEESKQIKKPFNPLFLILGAVSVVIGIVLFALSLIPAVILTVLGIILLVLSFIIRPQNKSLTDSLQNQLGVNLNETAILREEKNTVTGEITTLSGKMNLLAAALNTDNAIRLKRETDLSEKKEAIAEAKKEALTTKDKIVSIIGKYCDSNNEDNVKETIYQISANAEEINRVKIALNLISKDLGGISYSEAEAKLKSLNSSQPEQNIDYDQLKNEAESLSSLLYDLNSQITAGEVELKTAFRGFENPETLKREINILSEDLTAKKDFCDAAEIANEILYNSFLEVRKGYGTAVEQKTLEIFSFLTGERYSALNISKELDITVEQKNIFGTREIGYLSRGTAEQAYLSLRLAISELMSDAEHCPVMLDDVLSQYDEARTEAAIKFLKEYSKKSQIVLFTCHNSVCEAAKKSGIDIRPLRSDK